MTRVALEGYVLDVGFSNTVPAHRVTGIMSYDSEPLRRFCQDMERMHRVIDATKGRKVKSLVVLDSQHIILSSLARETLSDRFSNLLPKESQAMP
ncbi:MAG: DUF370 domain-containing protein [bacterium]|jgi:hypothetical protein